MITEELGFFDGFFQESSMIAFFISIGFIIVIAGFAYTIIKGLYTWTSNNGKQVMRELAKLIAKRTELEGGSGDSMGTRRHIMLLICYL